MSTTPEDSEQPTPGPTTAEPLHEGVGAETGPESGNNTPGDSLAETEGGQKGPKKPAQEPPQQRPQGLLGYFQHRPDPLTSLLLTVPIFLVYHLGILAIDLRNGADLISNLAFSLLEQSQLAYLGVTAAYVVGIGAAAFVLRRTGKIQTVSLLPIVAESLVLAILMTATVGWATQQIVSAQVGEPAMNPFAKLVMAAGAGFHEELLRVGLFAGGSMLLHKVLKKPAWQSALIAALVSSFVFSAVHYFGELGDTFTFASFVFRFLAGLYFALVYRFRGFAVAVYTHAIYDFLVFFVLS